MPNIITATELREILNYCPETGIFRWIKGRSNVLAGSVAGCNTDIRILIGINGKLYKAHRLAWLYMNGVYPPDMIDHIDGNKGNNKYSNLRMANNSENGQNRKKARSDSQTGLIGVTQHKPTGKFKASIQFAGKRHSLGYFDTPELAHQAYLNKKREVHSFNTL